MKLNEVAIGGLIKLLKTKGPGFMYDRYYSQGENWNTTVGAMEDLTPEIWAKLKPWLQKEAEMKKRPPKQMRALDSFIDYIDNSVLQGKTQGMIHDTNYDLRKAESINSLFKEGGAFALREEKEKFFERIL